MSEQPIHLETRDTEGEKQFSPSAGRNSAVIGEILENRLPLNARVLEIASGTGQHAAHVCQRREDIIWQCSDPNDEARCSQNAWGKEFGARMPTARTIDTMTNVWWKSLDAFDAIYCANMVHIAPWEAALGLADGAAHILSDDGFIFLYGPFQEDSDTAPSNLEFDQNLKRRNPKWGVRDLQSVKYIFADIGFTHMTRIVMPKENRLLIFSK